ncbi:MAG TPA: fluoride efflux transporter CrcB [Verrucomicrobiae bacterium]|nr:fluoride efflux transporter CrcB [Verrucomicrobiae bacterium]
MSWRALLAVALGGGVGSVLRYAVGYAVAQWLGPGFPWGTLAINVAGSFAIGLIAELAQTRALGVTPLVRIFAAVGVLGGFTTFSTFALDMVTLAGERAQALALAYAAGSVALGFAAAFAGIVVARLMVL